MKIIPYEDSFFDPLVQFLKKNWAVQHAIYDKSLFNWQYRIKEEEATDSFLVLKEEKIIGFLGNIPSFYDVDGTVQKGAGLTMWVIDEEYRNSGLGILLLKETEKKKQVTFTLGCNLNVVPMYKRMGYSYSENLNRYVLPLNSDKYKLLLQEQVNTEEIDQWVNEISENFSAEKTQTPNTEIRVEDLEALYKRSIIGEFRFSQHRNASFWDWRYKNSNGYKYLYFGNEHQGVAVIRVDRAYSPNDTEIHGTKILRIIELIPANKEVWSGFTDPDFIKILGGILNWARDMGCVAADFQISTNRLEHLLLKVGFRKQNYDYTPALNGLAGLFQPFRYKVNPINFTWKVRNELGETLNFDINDTYFVKSDCDMDRPNIWPLPSEWSEE